MFSIIHFTGCSQQYIIEGVLNNTLYRVFSTIYYCKGPFSNIWYSVYLTKHCTRCFIVQGVFNKTLYRVFYCTRCLQRKIVRGVILHRVSLTIYCKGRCFAPNFSAFCTECPWQYILQGAFKHCTGRPQQYIVWGIFNKREKGVISIGCLQQNIYRVSYCTVCPQQYIVQGVLNNE